MPRNALTYRYVTEMKQSCGTSRNGCILCLFVKEDSMLKYFLDKGEEWAGPILELRSIMRNMLFDANFREPIRRKRLKMLDAIDPFGRNQDDGQLSIFSLEEKAQMVDGELPYEPLCIGGKPANPDLELASFTLEGRIFLLKNVLYYQDQAGLEIVSRDDIEYIKMVWRQEMGWVENEHDLIPEAVPYCGSLVLDKKYHINEKESTISNLVVDPEFYAIEEALQHQGRGHEVRLLLQNADLHILNRTKELSPETMNFVFYITTDFGSGEEGIYDVLNRAKAMTGINIPYYWVPVVSKENAKNIFWNNVTFVVSRPEIKTSVAARSFVDSFIEAGSNHSKTEVYDYEKYYWFLIQGKSQFDSKRTLYKLGMHPKQLPDTLKSFVGINDEELMVAHAIKSSVSDGISRMPADKAGDLCNTSSCWDEVFWSLIYEFRTPELVKQHLIEKGYVAEVVPESIKFYADINDLELYFGNKIKVYGLRECLNSLLFLPPDQHIHLPEFIKEALDKYFHELRGITIGK